MMFRILLIMMAVAALTLGGCEKQEPAEPAQTADTEQVEVTEENLDSELDKMEAQIEADLEAEE